MIQLDSRSRTNKSDSDSQYCYESDSTQKLPTPQPWCQMPNKKAGARNRGCKCLSMLMPIVVSGHRGRFVPFYNARSHNKGHLWCETTLECVVVVFTSR